MPVTGLLSDLKVSYCCCCTYLQTYNALFPLNQCRGRSQSHFIGWLLPRHDWIFVATEIVCFWIKCTGSHSRYLTLSIGYVLELWTLISISLFCTLELIGGIPNFCLFYEVKHQTVNWTFWSCYDVGVRSTCSTQCFPTFNILLCSKLGS